MKNCLIFGVTGQDGFYLSRYLMSLGFNVYGTSRKHVSEIPTQCPIMGLNDTVEIIKCNINNEKSIAKAFEISKPQFVFNLASQSSVSKSFSKPKETIESIVAPTMFMLEIIRNKYRDAHFYNASSSEVFGNKKSKVRSSDVFDPRSPYAAGKAAASMLVNMYRETYDIFACNGYTFNHESIYRPDIFVTKKIFNFIIRDELDANKDTLELGNLNIYRDWGLAEEYVEAMTLLLFLDKPKDCVICTGQSISLLQFVQSAFEFQNKDYTKFIMVNKDLFRKNELFKIEGDSSEASELINWSAKTRGTDVIKSIISELLQKKI